MTIGVIFDCDGVLLDSAHAWRDAEAELGRCAHAQVTPEDSRALAAMTIAEVGSYFHEKFGLAGSGEEVVVMIDQIMLDFYANRVEPLAGVGDLLDDLAGLGARLSVVSSTQTDLLRIGLSRAGLLERFCAVLSVEDLDTNKREPLIYRRAMEVLGTTPETTWGFDDSYYAIETMSALGIATVGVYDALNPFELDTLRARADQVVCDYATLDRAQFARPRQ